MLAQVGILADVDITITLSHVAGGNAVAIDETVVGRVASWAPWIAVPIQRARHRRSVRTLLTTARSSGPIR